MIGKCFILGVRLVVFSSILFGNYFFVLLIGNTNEHTFDWIRKIDLARKNSVEFRQQIVYTHTQGIGIDLFPISFERKERKKVERSLV